MILSNRSFIGLLLAINLFGTVYGYYWYRYQLAETPAKFLLFVPDSPTASLFCASIDRVFMEKKLAANGSAGSSNII